MIAHASRQVRWSWTGWLGPVLGLLLLTSWVSGALHHHSISSHHPCVACFANHAPALAAHGDDGEARLTESREPSRASTPAVLQAFCAAPGLSRGPPRG